jgi:quercetin dioxygenase-like cupin family protein
MGRLAGACQHGAYLFVDGRAAGVTTLAIWRSSRSRRAHVLMKSAATAPAGRAAETVYGGHEHVLRQTLIALTAGAALSEHENPGEATLQVLAGRVRLVADATEWEGRDGDFLIVPQARHTLHAVEDSAVLLTVAKLPYASGDAGRPGLPFRTRKRPTRRERLVPHGQRLVTPVDGGAWAGWSLLIHAAPLRSLGAAAGGMGWSLSAGAAVAGAPRGCASRVRCGCGTAGRRSRTSAPWGTSVSSWHPASTCSGPARPAIDAGPLARALWCRGGRVLVVVVGAAQPVGLGRDGLVLDHGGAAVWYRPVVTMRHR